MADYDYASIDRYIKMHSDLIDSVQLGIKEDWWWTAEEVYREDHFLLDLLTEPEIAGIKGSFWGTPCMVIYFKDGSHITKNCYSGDIPTGTPPEWFELGVPTQDVKLIGKES